MAYKIDNLRRICLLFAACLLSNGLNAQSVDSLVLKFTDDDGIVNTDSMFAAGKKNLYTDPDRAFELARRLVGITEKQKDRLARANSYRYLGACFVDYDQNFDSANHYYRLAEKLYRSIDAPEGTHGLGATLHNYGVINHYQGDYLKAIENYTEALRIFNPMGDFQVRPMTLNNLSSVYAFLKDYPKSEQYARRCVALAREKENTFMEANGLMGLADALLSQKKFAEALPTIEAAMKIGTENDYLSIVRVSYLNLGNYYYAQKDYPRATQAIKKSLELAVRHEHEWDVMRNKISLADLYIIDNRHIEAYAMADQGLAIARNMGAKDMQERALLFRAKATALERNFEVAYHDLIAAYTLRDTLFDEDKQRQLAFLEAEYQTEQKELRIGMLERQRRLYIWLGIAGAVILLGALAFAVVRYRLAASRRKLAEEESSRLQREKQLVAAQAALDSEAAERTRLAKDLHDGLGSMLSVVKLNLPQMKGGTVVGAIDVPRFQKALGMLDESIQELRRVAHHMMPESLMRYGLKASLSDFCGAIPGVDFHYFGNEGRLPEQLEILIYRCIHELVNNALKHAAASHINVQLVQEPDRVSFTVQDDGVGFDQHTVAEGMGLQNVRQRVAAFQGEMSIYSSEQGTEIHVELELKSNEQ